MSKIYNVYWIHREQDTDITQNGYIGISCNVKSRLLEHKRSGNQHLTNAFNKYKDIRLSILLQGTKEYCSFIEEKLRPNQNIGWNIEKGGGIPPSWFGKKRVSKPRSEETKQKISNTMKGRVLTATHLANLKQPKTETHKFNLKKPKKDSTNIALSNKLRSKTYLISTKTESFLITNLKQWCKDNDLCSVQIHKLKSGKIQTYAGYTNCEVIT